MADKEPDKVPDKVKVPDKMEAEKKKKKTSHLSSSEIAAALDADADADADADEVTTPKTTHSTHSVRRKLVLPPKITSGSHEGSADLFDDSITDITMPTLSESMLAGMSFVDRELERDKDAEIFGDDLDDAADPTFKLPDLEPPSDEEDDVDELYVDTSLKRRKSLKSYPTIGTPRAGTSTPRAGTSAGTSTPTAGTSTGSFTTPTGPFKVPDVPARTGVKRVRHDSEPSTPTTPRQPLFPAELKLLPGARTNHAYYAFFKVEDLSRPHVTSGIDQVYQMQARCMIKNSAGEVCNRLLQQSHNTTSGLISHLKSKHKREEAMVQAETARQQAEINGTWDKIKHLYAAKGGVHETQEDVDAAEKDLGKRYKSSAFLLILRFSND